MRSRFLKRSRRFTIAVVVMAALFALGIASTAVAVEAYVYQSGGRASYSYQGWYTSDWVPLGVDNEGVFDLHASVLAAYAESWDLGDLGTPDEPAGTGVVTALNKAVVYLDSTDIYSNGSPNFRGAQGIFASGTTTMVSLDSCNIVADQYSGRGLVTQKSGSIVAGKCSITTYSPTEGAAVASVYTGGGSISLDDSRVETWGGPGSPAFYSTGGFYVSDSQVFSHESDGAWLDGGGSLIWLDQQNYSLVMYNSSVYAAKGNGVSFAKGPLSLAGNDNPAGLWMSACYLESAGPSFYAPNSLARIILEHTTNYSYAGVLLSTDYAGKGPGGGQPSDTNDPGARESTVAVYAWASTLRGDVVTDVDESSGKPSVVDLSLADWTFFEGAVNRADQGIVNLTFAHESNWEVTDTSHVGRLTVPTISNTVHWGDGLHWQDFEPDLAMIHSHGNIVYYDPLVNGQLGFRTYRLPEGGWLVPSELPTRGGVRPGLQ